MKTIKILTAAALTAMLASAFMGCSSDGGDDPVLPLPPSHEHTYSDSWSYDENQHWQVATCGHDVKKDEAPHEWDHEDFQYDAASGNEIKTCTVCGFVADKNHTHTEDNGTVTTAPTCVTKGVKTYKCTVYGEILRTEEIPELYSSPIDAETGLPATKATKYIYFGVFPKSVLPANSTVTVNETVFVKMGADTYYKGSDGEYYAKVKEQAYSSSTIYKYSDGTQAKQNSSNSYRYFKVEPIKWKVITDSYSGKCLLLAEDILTADVPYYDYFSTSNTRTVGSDTGIYINNYKYSQIRAYLNGLDYYYDQSISSTVKKTDYTDKGFLQTAFTAEAQNLIAVTTVDNSAASTTDSGNNVPEATDCACADTEDKIFLLSLKEATSYGFPAYSETGEDNARIRKTTDYAKANYADQGSAAGKGYWWLRSPEYSLNRFARYVAKDGSASYDYYVHAIEIGVVPALSISLQ